MAVWIQYFLGHVVNSSSTALANICQESHVKSFSSVCIRVCCTSKDYLHQKIFGHYLRTCTGSHQNVYMYIKYHLMKMGSYISHRFLSAMHTDAYYKGELATTNITCTFRPLHVYDEAGGHVPTVQRLCHK